jgi:DNA-binding NarL/FixJ family response regulator
VKILVVDDSRAVRARLHSMLAEEPGVVAVSESEGVAAAVAQLGALRPDVVVLDLHLHGGESGLAVLSAIAGPQRPCVIILSNDAGVAYRREAKLRGADHFFDKSTEFEQVAAIVRELIVGA